MPEQTEEITFAALTDRTRLDRLQGEILAFVSDFEEHGYSNMEIARELLAAAFKRAQRDKGFAREHFHEYVRDCSIRWLAAYRDGLHELAVRYLKKGN